MLIDKKYVVVDLETTGTQFKNGDKIIQFAAVTIEHSQIVRQDNFLINPQQPLSAKISELTGITDAQLSSQPVFAHFVPQIKQILQDAVFVAHNVNFDLPFLQAELQAADQSTLDNSAIDTVELAQILLPQAPSFKLADLTNYLNIEHLNPHQANSDALVTAQLFLYLQEQLRHLPQPTLRLLKHFTKSLIRQTGDFMAAIIDQACAQPQALPDYLVEVHGLVLQKPRSLTGSLPLSSKYPTSTAKKEKLFDQVISSRPQQMKMMNFVHRKLEQKSPLALVDAPTGLGKTLGYLFPLSYYLDQGKPVIIATSTKLLQQQLLQESLPLLSKLRQRHYSATVINSAHNYLDLDNFYQILPLDTGHRPADLLKMRLIVWLTQTRTGSLAELNLTNYQSNLFKLIVSNGHRQSGLFMQYDFWHRRCLNAAQSDVIITNQAYLLKNIDLDLWKSAQVLIVDEANNLIQQSLRPQARLQIRPLKDALKKTSDILYQQRVTIRSFFHQSRLNSWGHNDLLELDNRFNEVRQQIQILEADLLSNYIKKMVPLSQRQQPLDLPLKTQQVHTATIKTLNKLAQILQALLSKLSYLFKLYQQVADNSVVVIDQIMYHLQIEYQTILFQERQLEEVLASLSIWQQNTGLIVHMVNYNNWDSLSLATQIFDHNLIMDYLQEKFQTTILVGAALAYQHSFHNFCQQLGLTQKVPAKDYLLLKRDYPLDQQIQIYLPNNTPSPRKVLEFDEFLPGAIAELLLQNDCKTLVMFNSLQTLQRVYDYLQTTALDNQREILAQGITGSAQRLKKRFALNKNAILLAANSFGEGLNLSNGDLSLVIISRLPFEAPDNPFVKAKNNYWQQQGLNPFKVESLPTAARRLKQEVGRLIRSPSDHGAVVILDRRLATTKYGQRLYKELDLPDYNQELTLPEIALQIKMFLKTNF